MAGRSSGGFRRRAVRPSRDQPTRGHATRALVRRFELDLAAGHHLALIGELGVLVQDHLDDERLRGQLMLALYRSGRQVDALRVFRDGRRLWSISSAWSRHRCADLHDAILRHDPSLDLLASPTPAETPTRPLRYWLHAQRAGRGRPRRADVGTG